MKNIILHIVSNDQKGLVSKFTSLLYLLNTNILSLEQYVEPENDILFMRIHTDKISQDVAKKIKNEISILDRNLNSKTTLYYPNTKMNMAILGSNEILPVYDILLKNESNELESNIRCIISNHRKLENLAGQFKIPYHHINSNNFEKEMLNLFKIYKINFIVLARFMRIIPDSIIKKFKGKIINIHHGFLPAFKGENPYRKAWKRGVKIIGATAHYANEILDEGPIISQETISVSHHQSIKQMVQAGRNLERNVLIEAMKAHLEHRIIIHGNRTIIFQK